MSTGIKFTAAAAVIAATAAFSTAAEARCVSSMQSGYSANEIAQLTLQAHRSRKQPGNWDADNRWPFGENGPHGPVRVGRFDFHDAVEKCERQHVRTGSEYTGLTCNGRDVYVIGRGQPGPLVCRR